MLNLLVQMIELLIMVVIVFALVKRFGRVDRRPSVSPKFERSSVHDNRSVVVEHEAHVPHDKSHEASVETSGPQVETKPTGQTRLVKDGDKVVRLEEFARGNAVVTRVSRVKRDGQTIGNIDERTAPINEVVDTIIRR